MKSLGQPVLLYFSAKLNFISTCAYNATIDNAYFATSCKIIDYFRIILKYISFATFHYEQLNKCYVFIFIEKVENHQVFIIFLSMSEFRIMQ